MGWKVTDVWSRGRGHLQSTDNVYPAKLGSIPAAHPLSRCSTQVRCHIVTYPCSVLKCTLIAGSVRLCGRLMSPT